LLDEVLDTKQVRISCSQQQQHKIIRKQKTTSLHLASS
jgi:hypothetical protein